MFIYNELMDSQRIECIKYNFDRLTDDELTGIRGHLLVTHARVTDEIGLIERKLFERHNDQLPIELGATAISTEIEQA